MIPKLLLYSLLFLFLGFSREAYAQSDSSWTLPSWAMGGFERPPGINPLISPKASQFFDPILHKFIAWESNDTFNPAAAVLNNQVIVLYRAEDPSGIGIGFRTSRLGYASSPDGIHFRRRSKPVLFPGPGPKKKYEWPGGCEDPRLARTPEGVFWVYYTEWNRDLPRLGVASSRDLIHWKKYGPIFAQAYHGKFLNIAHKSASILTEVQKGKQVIIRIQGKYWMYWGEQHVYGANSPDLIHWNPILNPDSSLREYMSPRKGFFDSDLTECGPPALRTSKGIILFYNGKNKSGPDADPRFNPNSYSAGQALFDRDDPGKFLKRLDIPFLRPREAFEKSGQYRAGTVFIEGMAFFHKKWFLYYGCADSKVGVAIFNPLNPSLPDPI
jgi:predicted GH43/DUF377 family glycosyl hydrolase